MEDKKTIHCKFTYKCGVCGKEHHNVLDRANCEIECTRKAEEEARKATEAKKQAEQNDRKAEVDAAFENLHKLVTKYVNDYGHYEYNDGGENTNFYWPTRTWYKFW